MNATIPSDLLKLKAQFEAWRKNRPKRSPIPDHLRKAAIALLDQCSPSMICRVCRLHSRMFQDRPAPKASNKSAPDFFPLPLPPAHPGIATTIGQTQTDCRLLLERPDGAKLTVFLPSLDDVSISALCNSFLRS